MSHAAGAAQTVTTCDFDPSGRGVHAGAQREPGAAGWGVGGQLILQARVEHSYIDHGHVRTLIRVAISVTSWRANVSLSARGSSRSPAASTSVSALSSKPNAA